MATDNVNTVCVLRLLLRRSVISVVIIFYLFYSILVLLEQIKNTKNNVLLTFFIKCHYFKNVLSILDILLP